MPSFKLSLPTIGILPGWAVMEGKIPDRYLAAVLRGLQTTAREQGCHLMLAWGLGRVTDVIGLHPAWPVASPDADFVPVGPWNTEGLEDDFWNAPFGAGERVEAGKVKRRIAVAVGSSGEAVLAIFEQETAGFDA